MWSCHTHTHSWVLSKAIIKVGNGENVASSSAVSLIHTHNAAFSCCRFVAAAAVGGPCLLTHIQRGPLLPSSSARERTFSIPSSPPLRSRKKPIWWSSYTQQREREAFSREKSREKFESLESLHGEIFHQQHGDANSVTNDVHFRRKTYSSILRANNGRQQGSCRF